MRSSILPLFRRSLGDSWRSLIGWSVGVTAAIFMYVPLFPSLATDDMQAMIDSLPDELINALGYDQLSSGGGYVHSTFYGLIGFLLLTIAATSWGTAAIAGDEETGSLDLTLAHGVTRTQVVLERAAAVIVRLAWLTVLSGLLVLLLNDSAELDIEPQNLVAELGAFLGLVLLSASFALAVGALTGRRAFATTAGAGIAVLGYALNAIGNQSEDLDWLHAASPYHWAYGESPITNGAEWGGLGLLYALSALLISIAVVALNRRDVIG